MTQTVTGQTTGLTFRAATPADAPAIGTFQLRAWEENYSDFLPTWALQGFSAEERIAAWRQILSRPAFHDDTLVVMAERGGRLVGFGALGAQRSARLRALGYSGEISALYVARALQRQGIGRRLLARLFDDLSARGHAAASLWVIRGNQAALDFLDSTGARPIRLAGRGQMSDDLAYGWRDLGRPDRLSWSDARRHLTPALGGAGATRAGAGVRIGRESDSSFAAALPATAKPVAH